MSFGGFKSANPGGGFGSAFSAGVKPNAFGTPIAANTAFGAATTAATGFGASTTLAGNTGGFGASVSGGGGLFGSAPAANTGTGLFGSVNPAQTNTAFGSGALFGQNQNAAQPVNTGLSFGNTGAAGTSGFGAPAQNTGGLFNGPSTNNVSGFGGAATNTGNAFQSATTGFGGGPTGFGGATGFGGVAKPPVAGFTPLILKENNVGVAVMTQLPGGDPAALGLNHVEERIKYMREMAGANGGMQAGFGAVANNPVNRFGQSTTTPAGSGFGTGFGAPTNQATGGSLFGMGNAAPAPATTAAPAGNGLFGRAGPAVGGFGSAPAATSGAGGGFGTGFGSSTNNALGSGFGAPAGGVTGGFGATAAPSGNLFGSNTAAANSNAPFGPGNTNTPNAGTGGLFGTAGTTNMQTAGTTTGATGLFGAGPGSGFGMNQAQVASLNTTQALKPAGTLFGVANNTNQPAIGAFGTGTGVSTVNPTPGLFGTANTATNTAANGGIFGSNQNTSGTGLFGTNASNTAANAAKPFGSGGGLFGQTSGAENPNPIAPGGGLFGNAQASGAGLGGGIFGSAAAKPAVGGLFGNAGAVNNPLNRTGLGVGLGQQTAAASSTGLTSSLFGNTSGATNTLQGLANNSANSGVAGLTASLLDPPYSNTHLFASLSGIPVQAGPLAEQVVKPGAQRRLPPLPQNRLKPGASRLLTPQRNFGQSASFALSYSPYMGAGSVSSSPLARSIGPSTAWSSSLKTQSSGNYRGESTLFSTPTALDPSTLRSGSSMRRLTIRNDLRRSSLFAGPESPVVTTTPPKKMLYMAPVTYPPKEDGDEEAGRTPTMSGAIVTTSPTVRMPSKADALRKAKEKSKQGLAYARMFEPRDEGDPAWVKLNARNAELLTKYQRLEPGRYYCRPEIEELQSMTKQELQSVDRFVVGRQFVGMIEFLKPVDLSKTPLDRLLGEVVVLEPTAAAVYPTNRCKVPKEKPGEGLNQPATVTLQGGWPPEVMRFANSALGTNAVSNSVLNPQDKIRRMLLSYRRNLKSKVEVQEVQKFEWYDITDGTYQLTVRHFSTHGLDAHGGPLYIEEEELTRSVMPGGFAYPRSMIPPAREPVAAPMPVLAPTHVQMSNPAPATPMSAAKRSVMPRSVLKSRRNDGGLETPGRPNLAPPSGWTSRLMDSVSPQKNRDREQLRQHQRSMLVNTPFSTKTKKFAPQEIGPVPMMTSIDLLQTLFVTDPVPAGPSGPSSFQWPYAKKQKVNHRDAEADGKPFPYKPKPVWADDGTIVYVSSRTACPADFQLADEPLQSGQETVMFLASTDSSQVDLDSVELQEKLTDCSLVSGIPLAEARLKTDFAAFANSTILSLSTEERNVLRLASILFDPVTDLVDVGESEDSIRTGRLQEFWREMILPDLAGPVRQFKTLPEQAFVYLSGGDVSSAVEVLYKADCLSLASLVTSIGGDATFRANVEDQIESWMSRDFVSEFAPSIRALYALLHGQTCVVAGKSGSGYENTMQDLVLSDYFDLDWRRAFGLRLWYGILAGDSIEKAVEMFAADLKSGSEPANPVKTGDVDVMWGLLQLFSATRSAGPLPGPAFLAVEQDGLANVNHRLGFQLSQLLMPMIRNQFPKQELAEYNQLADRIASSYSEQHLLCVHQNRVGRLGQPDSLLPLLLFPVLHIRNPVAREDLIRGTLERFAYMLPTEDDPLFDRLTGSAGFHIPASWLFASRATFAIQFEGDPIMQATWLLRGQMVHKAHEVLHKTIGPRAIVEADLRTLRMMLDAFAALNAEKVVPNWSDGGAVLADFVTLIDLAAAESRSSGQAKKDVERKKRTVLVRLARALRDNSERDTSSAPPLLIAPSVFPDEQSATITAVATTEATIRQVAMHELSRLVAGAIEADPYISKTLSVVLNFPFDSTLRRRYAVDLAGGVYARAMCGLSSMSSPLDMSFRSDRMEDESGLEGSSKTTGLTTSGSSVVTGAKPRPGLTAAPMSTIHTR